MDGTRNFARKPEPYNFEPQQSYHEASKKANLKVFLIKFKVIMPKVIIHKLRGKHFFLEQKLRLGLVWGWLAILKKIGPIMSNV